MKIINNSIYIKFLFIITMSILVFFAISLFLLHKVKVIKQEPIVSESVCDEVLKMEELDPVKMFDDKPAKVKFSNYPDAKTFYTTITEQASEGPNFAGHFTFVGWGCGTNCVGYAVVDSITGEVVTYLPANEDGNSYSYDINSRILVLNPKKDYENFKGKTLKEIFNEDNWYTGSIRQYYKLSEDFEGVTSLYKICSESSLDGIYSY